MLPNLRTPPPRARPLTGTHSLPGAASCSGGGSHPEQVADSGGGPRPVLWRLQSARLPLTLWEGGGGPVREEESAAPGCWLRRWDPADSQDGAGCCESRSAARRCVVREGEPVHGPGVGWVRGRRWRESGELANGAPGCPQDPASGAGRPWTARGASLISGCWWRRRTRQVSDGGGDCAPSGSEAPRLHFRVKSDVEHFEFPKAVRKKLM